MLTFDKEQHNDLQIPSNLRTTWLHTTWFLVQHPFLQFTNSPFSNKNQPLYNMKLNTTWLFTLHQKSCCTKVWLYSHNFLSFFQNLKFFHCKSWLHYLLDSMFCYTMPFPISIFAFIKIVSCLYEIWIIMSAKYGTCPTANKGLARVNWNLWATLYLRREHVFIIYNEDLYPNTNKNWIIMFLFITVFPLNLLTSILIYVILLT